MTTKAVETVNLSKHYGHFVALDNLSISIDRGRILGFIGPNGAGKTTTIKILVGLARPTSGNAFIEGVDCYRQARRIKKMVGYMPDTFGSYDNMRVREYLDFFGAAFGIPWLKRNKRIDEVLEITSATYMQDLFVESLSHGMKQRVGIARTLLHDPSVLILDEPANGLDPRARIEMRDLLLALASAGKTLIVTSHILPELSRICDQVAIITRGKLRAFGTLPEIMKQVSQKRTVEIQLAGDTGIQHAEEILKTILAADSDESNSISSSATEHIVRFETEKQDQELAAILSQLVEHGICVAQFRELQSDLEDAFLSVTQADETAEAGSAKGESTQADSAETGLAEDDTPPVVSGGETSG